MIQETTVFIQSFLVSYGTWAFFLLGFMEEVFFFIPSGLLFLAIGFFAIDAAAPFGFALTQAFGPIAFAGSFGVLAGASLMYALAYSGGKPLILKFGKYCGVRWEEIEKLNRFFGRGYADELVLIFLRAIPIFPISVVSLLCGAVRIRPTVFTVTTFIGTVFRVGSLSLFGWYAGREFSLYAEKIALFEQVVVVIGVVAVLIFLFIRLTARRSGR
jgi:membrane protein DedA with SNARE-associated domain